MGNTQCVCAEAKDANEASGDFACASGAMMPGELAAAASKPLTDKEIGLVESTWKRAAGLGVEAVGVMLFKHIFAIAPEALALFSFKKEANVKSYETPGLKAHGVKVVSTVGTAVDGLRNLPALVPVLKELAIRHVGYGVAPKHYEVVGKALMLTLKGGLGVGFTPPVQVAWSKVWHVLSTTMIEAAGPAFEERQAAAAKKPASAGGDAPINPAEIKLVKDSWAKAAALGTEAVGVALFKNIFTAAPEAVQLFSFKDDWKNSYENPKLKAHGVKVVSTVDTAVGMLTNLEGLVPVLKELGTKHVGYMVQKPHYDVVGAALIKTLSDALAAEFTEDTKAAWLKVWGLVSTTMMGTHYA